MNVLTRWDPLKELEELQNRIGGWWTRLPTRPEIGREEAMTVAQWAPLVDITEDEKEFVVKAELPEVKKDEVKVTVESGVLAITGERKIEREEKGKKYHRIERGYGSFYRSFSLPEGADGTKVFAEFRDGVLKVHIPKTEKSKPKMVDVKVD